MKSSKNKKEINEDFVKGLQMIITGQNIMIKALLEELEKYEEKKEK